MNYGSTDTLSYRDASCEMLMMMKQGSGRVGAGAGLEPGQGSAGAGKKQGRSWSREGREQRWGMEQEQGRSGV